MVLGLIPAEYRTKYLAMSYKYILVICFLSKRYVYINFKADRLKLYAARLALLEVHEINNQTPSKLNSHFSNNAIRQRF